MTPRFPITATQIDDLVAEFYARIRKHDVLGPIFLRAVGAGDAEWRAHEAKIASFWRNAVLLDRGYSGNPMRVHMENSEVEVAHFKIWLHLFRETAAEVLPPDAAKQIAALADRIGQALAFGIQNIRRDPKLPPILKPIEPCPI